MAGMKFEVRERMRGGIKMDFIYFQYDENGGKFYYFLLSVYGLILLPATYWLWPKVEKRSRNLSINIPERIQSYLLELAPHPEDTSNFTPCRDKHQLLHANEPNRRRRAIITYEVQLLATAFSFLSLAKSCQFQHGLFQSFLPIVYH